MEMIVNGIEVDVQKKNIKNIHLSVLPPDGKVRLSVPLDTKDNVINAFIRTRISWIKEQQESFSSQLRQTEREYVSGETVYLFGNQYFLKVIHSNKNSISIDGKTIIMAVRNNTPTESKEKLMNDWYRDLLKPQIEKRLKNLSEITGEQASIWQIQIMKTKWGSCNPDKKRLLFNLQLAKKPYECIDFVVTHEFCHLFDRTHGKVFVSKMDELLPRWRELKAQLNNLILDSWN